MNPTETVAPFHTHIEEASNGAEIQFHFRKPTLSELDRFSSKLAKAPVTTALAFCSGCVLEQSKTAWLMMVEERPGAASMVANALSEKLGFRQS
jgi:hypothetical protein